MQELLAGNCFEHAVGWLAPVPTTFVVPVVDPVDMMCLMLAADDCNCSFAAADNSGENDL